ncbi:MAG: hypothetical protein ACFFCO_09585, partial [Promethearchaeota archaeon]
SGPPCCEVDCCRKIIKSVISLADYHQMRPLSEENFQVFQEWKGPNLALLQGTNTRRLYIKKGR